MRTIKIYVPPGQQGSLWEFLSSLDEKLQRKLLRQIFLLSQVHLCDLKEPHFKHFVLATKIGSEVVYFDKQVFNAS